jgi:hypothetical protein
MVPMPASAHSEQQFFLRSWGRQAQNEHIHTTDMGSHLGPLALPKVVLWWMRSALGTPVLWMELWALQIEPTLDHVDGDLSSPSLHLCSEKDMKECTWHRYWLAKYLKNLYIFDTLLLASLAINASPFLDDLLYVLHF